MKTVLQPVSGIMLPVPAAMPLVLLIQWKVTLPTLKAMVIQLMVTIPMQKVRMQKPILPVNMQKVQAASHLKAIASTQMSF